jgi:hypothetical protein
MAKAGTLNLNIIEASERQKMQSANAIDWDDDERDEDEDIYSTSEEKERTAIELLQKRNLTVKPILNGYQIKNNTGAGSQVFHRQELAAINRLGDISFIEFDESEHV